MESAETVLEYNRAFDETVADARRYEFAKNKDADWVRHAFSSTDVSSTNDARFDAFS